MAVERCRYATRDYALVGLILVGTLYLCARRFRHRRHCQVGDVDNALHLAHTLEEIQYRVVRTIDLDVERSFREIFHRRYRDRRVVVVFVVCVRSLGLQKLDEAKGILLLRKEPQM